MYSRELNNIEKANLKVVKDSGLAYEVKELSIRTTKFFVVNIESSKIAIALNCLDFSKHFKIFTQQ